MYKEDDNPSKGLATDDKEKADILAEFYSSFFTKEPPGPIPEPKKQYLNSELRDTVFTEDRIKKKLMTLKTSKSPGPDQLHPRILKEMSHVITKPLQQIFTLSMDKNKLPSIWKKANVSPIFKKGKKTISHQLPPGQPNMYSVQTPRIVDKGRYCCSHGS